MIDSMAASLQDSLPGTAKRRLALVVEDNPEFREAISQALSKLDEGWLVRAATTGREGLAALSEANFSPDLALVDLGLPDTSGIAVIRETRARHPQVPIMVVSVLGGSDNVLAAIRAGARGYLHKADPVLSLSEAIKRVLAGEYPISASLARYLFNLVQTEPPEPGGEGALSPRELQLLRLLSQGYTAQEAAERMGVEVSTAQTFCRRIYQKLQVHSKVKALLAARERGLL